MHDAFLVAILHCRHDLERERALSVTAVGCTMKRTMLYSCLYMQTVA